MSNVSSRIWSVSLLLVFALGCDNGDETVRELAPSGMLVAVTPANEVFWVDPTLPGTVVGSEVITGLGAIETLAAIDYRPATKALYALSRQGRLYLIDATAHGTQIGTTTLVSGAEDFGIDFSPVADRLRVVNEDEENFRLNPATGIFVVDTPLSPPGSVSAVAYSNNTPAATLTTLFGIDYASDSLVRIGGADGNPSPNGGVITTVGPLGVNLSTDASFDIAPSGIAYAALPVGGVTQLYTVDLVTGAATLVGTLGDGGAVVGLSLAP